MAITPRLRSASVSRARRLAAPRSLNAPVTCMLSNFSQTSAPVRREIASLYKIGVRTTLPAIRSAAAWTSENVIMRHPCHPGQVVRKTLSLRTRQKLVRCTITMDTRSAKMDLQDLVGPVSTGRGHRDCFPDLLADQRLGQRRGDRQARGLDIGLMHANDLVERFALRLFIHQLHVGAELDVLPRQGGRIDHFGRRSDLLKFRNPALNEGLPFPRGMILGIF